MTQTEKTEALRELRHWFALGILTAEQKAAINKELSIILDTEVVADKKLDTVDTFLNIGGELHYGNYVILKDDPIWYSLVQVNTGETEKAISYLPLVDKIVTRNKNDNIQ